MEGDKTELTDKIESQEKEIADLKLKLTSKEMELEKANDLQYDMLDGEDDPDQTLEDGEESKYGLLSGDFNATRNESQI